MSIFVGIFIIFCPGNLVTTKVNNYNDRVIVAPCYISHFELIPDYILIIIYNLYIISWEHKGVAHKTFKVSLERRIRNLKLRKAKCTTDGCI